MYSCISDRNLVKSRELRKHSISTILRDGASQVLSEMFERVVKQRAEARSVIRGFGDRGAESVHAGLSGRK